MVRRTRAVVLEGQFDSLINNQRCSTAMARQRTSTQPTRPARSPQVPARRVGTGPKSAAVRERAVVALLSEKTVTEAAAKAGVDESTLRRWMSDDEAFQAEYAAARTAAYQAGIYRAQALTGRALDTLEALLDDEKHPKVRLGAARTVAEIGIHQHDAETIMAKLDEIESDQRRDQRR